MTNAVTSWVYKSPTNCIYWEVQRFPLFPTRHNHSLCYVNKTGSLSMDLSAAATNHAAAEKERPSLKAEAKLNLWQSDTSHLIQDFLFRVTLNITPPVFFFFFFPPSLLPGKLAKPLFSPSVSFFFLKKEKVAAGVPAFVTTGEKTESCDSARIKNARRTIRIKASQRVLREGFFFKYFFAIPETL